MKKIEKIKIGTVNFYIIYCLLFDDFKWKFYFSLLILRESKFFTTTLQQHYWFGWLSVLATRVALPSRSVPFLAIIQILPHLLCRYRWVDSLEIPFDRFLSRILSCCQQYTYLTLEPLFVF